MYVYAVTEREADDRDPLYFRATLKAAQDFGKKNWTPTFRPMVRILLVDVKATKESIVWLLNDHDNLLSLMKEGALRKWRLTARGGLKEIKEIQS